jgi:hypothetical protein
MPTSGRHSAAWSPKLFAFLFVIVGIVIGVITVVAILYRPGGFSVVAQGSGSSIEFKFAESRVDLGEMLDRLLSPKADGGTDSASRRRLVASVLQTHGFYLVPSPEAATALRRIEETDDTREFVRAVRTMLYDLAGPFSRPATFLDAPDDRMLLAIDDLYERNPASPVVAKLWEMSLDLQGIFALREINVSIREDKALRNGRAATCSGSMLLDKAGLARTAEGLMVGVRVDVARVCGPTSPAGLLAGKPTKIWMSPEDVANLTGQAISATEKDIDATLILLPKTLMAEPSGQ